MPSWFVVSLLPCWLLGLTGSGSGLPVWLSHRAMLLLMLVEFQACVSMRRVPAQARRSVVAESASQPAETNGMVGVAAVAIRCF